MHYEGLRYAPRLLQGNNRIWGYPTLPLIKGRKPCTTSPYSNNSGCHEVWPFEGMKRMRGCFTTQRFCPALSDVGFLFDVEGTPRSWEWGLGRGTQGVSKHPWNSFSVIEAPAPQSPAVCRKWRIKLRRPNRYDFSYCANSVPACAANNLCIQCILANSLLTIVSKHCWRKTQNGPPSASYNSLTTNRKLMFRWCILMVVASFHYTSLFRCNARSNYGRSPGFRTQSVY